MLVAHFLSILTDFLSDRLQRVVIGGHFNDYRNVISVIVEMGVPLVTSVQYEEEDE